MKNKNFTVLLFTLLTFSLSCSHWNAKEWEKLETRDFTFSRFYCYSKLDKTEKIFPFMKSFPLEEVTRLLEKIYGISINIDDFSAFLNEGDHKKITAKGLIFNSDFSWSLKEIPEKAIIFNTSRIMNDDTSGGDYIHKYDLIIKVNDRVRARFEGEAESREDVSRLLLKQLMQKAPLVSAEFKPEKKSAQSDKKKNEEERINKILKNLSPEERELLKKRFKK